MERLKPALIGGGLVCAQSLYYWDKLNAGTNCQPAMLTISGMAIAALQGIAIRAFSEDQYWRERPNFLAATTCVLIEQPALWFTDTKPLTILASIVKQITCHLIVGIVAP